MNEDRNPDNRRDTLFHKLFRIPAAAALVLIRAYQATAPVRPPMCRYQPSCSHYTAGCIRAYGLFAGLALGARRILRCNPLSPGGYDPVPERLARDGRDF